MANGYRSNTGYTAGGPMRSATPARRAQSRPSRRPQISDEMASIIESNDMDLSDLIKQNRENRFLKDQKQLESDGSTEISVEDVEISNDSFDSEENLTVKFNIDLLDPNPGPNPFECNEPIVIFDPNPTSPTPPTPSPGPIPTSGGGWFSHPCDPCCASKPTKTEETTKFNVIISTNPEKTLKAKKGNFEHLEGDGILKEELNINDFIMHGKEMEDCRGKYKKFRKSMHFGGISNTGHMTIFVQKKLDLNSLYTAAGVEMDVDTIKESIDTTKVIDVLRSNNTSKASYIYINKETAEEWTGPVHRHPDKGYMSGRAHTSIPHAALEKKRLPNVVVSDHRVASLIMNSSRLKEGDRILNNARNKFFTDFFTSEDDKGNMRFVFGALYGDLVRNNSFLSEIKNDHLYENAQILDIILTRNNLIQERNSRRLAGLKSGPSTERRSGEEVQLGTIKPLANVKNFSDSYKFFTGIDFLDKQSGIYEYEINMKIKDPTFDFILNMSRKLSEAETKLESTMGLLGSGQKYSYESDMAFCNEETDPKVVDSIVAAISVIMETLYYTSDLSSDAVNTTVKNYLFSLAAKMDPSKLQILMKFIKSKRKEFDSLYKSPTDADARFANVSRKKQGIIEINHKFSNTIKKKPFNSSRQNIINLPDNSSGVKQIGRKDFNRRFRDEIKKYYNSRQSVGNITTSTGRSGINASARKYLTADSIQVAGDRIPLPMIDQTNKITELLNNLNFQSKDPDYDKYDESEKDQVILTQLASIGISLDNFDFLRSQQNKVSVKDVLGTEDAFVKNDLVEEFESDPDRKNTHFCDRKSASAESKTFKKLSNLFLYNQCGTSFSIRDLDLGDPNSFISENLGSIDISLLPIGMISLIYSSGTKKDWTREEKDLFTDPELRATAALYYDNVYKVQTLIPENNGSNSATKWGDLNTRNLRQGGNSICKLTKYKNIIGNKSDVDLALNDQFFVMSDNRSIPRITNSLKDMEQTTYNNISAQLRGVLNYSVCDLKTADDVPGDRPTDLRG